MSLFSFILIIVKLCETCLLCGDYSFAKVINPRRWGKKCFLLLNFSLFYFVYYINIYGFVIRKYYVFNLLLCKLFCNYALIYINCRLYIN